MSEQRIILANGSRLLREMLNRILLKTENLEVVKEITDRDTLPTAIEEPDAEWVIMSLPVDNKLPEWTDNYIIDHPHVRFMAVAADGSYGINPGVMYSYPCVCRDGGYEIVTGLTLDDFSRGRMQATEQELREERASIENLL